MSAKFKHITLFRFGTSYVSVAPWSNYTLWEEVNTVVRAQICRLHLFRKAYAKQNNKTIILCALLCNQLHGFKSLHSHLQLEFTPVLRYFDSQQFEMYYSIYEENVIKAVCIESDAVYR